MRAFLTELQSYSVLIFPILAINFLTHIAYFMDQDGPAYLQEIRATPVGGRMVYLIGGNLNQPITDFQFLMESIQNEVGVTLIEYLPCGFNPERIAGQIITHIDTHSYVAAVYTISVGDQIGHYIRQTCGKKVPVIAVNPCTSPSFLKLPIRIALRTFSPILLILGWLSGWLSEFRWIPIRGNRYSIALLTSQWFYTAYGPQLTSEDQEGVIGAICSWRDEFLDNDRIEAAYTRVPIEFIDSGHGNIINDSQKYLTGMRALHRYIGGNIWKHAERLYIRDREYADH